MNDSNIIKHQWEKGESGNPKGRPKGSKSAITVLKEVMELNIPNDSELLMELRLRFPHHFGENEKTNMYKVAALRIASGILFGSDKYSIAYIREMYNRIEGLPVQRNELTGKGGKELPPFVLNIKGEPPERKQPTDD